MPINRNKYYKHTSIFTDKNNILIFAILEIKSF